MIHPTAIIHPGAKIAANVEIGPYAVIGEHDLAAADAQGRMHDLVPEVRGDAGAIGARVFIVTKPNLDDGAERRLVESDRFAAIAVEEQIGLDRHGLPFPVESAANVGFDKMGKVDQRLLPAPIALVAGNHIGQVFLADF